MKTVNKIRLDEKEEKEDFIEADQYNNDYDDDEDNLNNDDYDKDEELISKLKQLNGVKTKKQRTEIVSDELAVNLNSSNNSNEHKVKVHELLGSLKHISNIGPIKKLLSKVQKRTKVLETPLPRVVTEKAHRIAAYVQDSKELTKWDPVVKHNRSAEQLVFPLKKPDYTTQTTSAVAKTWKPETDLEREIAELLQASDNYVQDQKLLTKAELKALETMNLEELKEKRAEFLKLKAQQMYQEAKFKRIKRIKSKRYRKILRKEKLKQEEKEMTNLEKENPEGFREKLEQLQKKRIEERMSLKHKNTSKWAKQQVKYGKYNDDARQAIQDQLDMSKQLTKKVPQLNNNDDSDEEEMKEQQSNVTNESQNIALKLQQVSNNPWISFLPTVNGNSKKSGDKPIDAYKKPEAFVNKEEIEKAQQELDDDDESEDESDDEYERILRSKIEKPKVEEKKESSDEEEDDSEKEEVEEKKQKPQKKNKSQKTTKKSENKKEIDEEMPQPITKNKTEAKEPQVGLKIDPNKVMIVNEEIINKQINECEDDICGGGNSFNENRRIVNKNNTEEHRLTLVEAFADDDVVEEFKSEKRKIEEDERVKPIDLTLPGWGDWTGAGIDESAKKKKKKFNKRNGKFKRRLVIHPPPNEKLRRDKDLENVIISEKKDLKIAAYQISELPHQFKCVEDFEKKLSQPIGRTWNPESKYKRLTQPKIKTRMGSIIEPIEKDDVILNKKKKK